MGDQDDRIISTVDEAKYITKAATPLFDYVTKQQVLEAEDACPKTVQCLFDVAFSLMQGNYGEKIKELYALDIPHKLANSTLLVLMLIYLNNTHHEWPEVFEGVVNDSKFKNLCSQLKNINIHAIETWLLSPGVSVFIPQIKPVLQLTTIVKKLDIPLENMSAFQKIFHSFLANLVHPSQILVELLVSKHLTHRASDAAMLIRQPIQRAKAFEYLISELLHQKRSEEALRLWKLILTPHEKHRSASKIVHYLIESDEIAQAKDFIDSIPSREFSSQLVRDMALSLGKKGKIVEALRTAATIENSDLQSYTYSNLVYICGQHSNYEKACTALQLIKDKGFREDGIMKIVKMYLAEKRFDEAMEFVDSLIDIQERQKPAKLIEAALKIQSGQAYPRPAA
jgi:pentatricopeptide repeat protein